MRQILAMCVVVAISAGCQSITGDRAHVGYHFSIDKPSSIDTNTPVLVQQTSGATNLHPMGTTAGPVSDGQFNQAPTAAVPVMPKTAVIYRRTNPNMAMASDPCDETGRLTAAEWCKIMSQMNAQRMPVGQPAQ